MMIKMLKKNQVFTKEIKEFNINSMNQATCEEKASKRVL